MFDVPMSRPANKSSQTQRWSAQWLPSIAMAFTPPDEKTIRNAIGDLDGLPPVLQRAFTPDKNSFDPIPEPKPGDWLAVHNERGQTFEEFKASQPNRPGQNLHVIYLQPLGDFMPEQSPSNDKLREFAAAFFATEVKVLRSEEHTSELQSL